MLLVKSDARLTVSVPADFASFPIPDALLTRLSNDGERVLDIS